MVLLSYSWFLDGMLKDYNRFKNKKILILIYKDQK